MAPLSLAALAKDLGLASVAPGGRTITAIAEELAAEVALHQSDIVEGRKYSIGDSAPFVPSPEYLSCCACAPIHIRTVCRNDEQLLPDMSYTI